MKSNKTTFEEDMNTIIMILDRFSQEGIHIAKERIDEYFEKSVM